MTNPEIRDLKFKAEKTALAIKKIMENLRFRDSKKDVLIQLADMVAGSLRRDFEHNTNDWNVYRKIIKNKEEDIWEFK